MSVSLPGELRASLWTPKRVPIPKNVLFVAFSFHPRGRKKYLFPLVDLEALDIDSPNCQPVNDYRTWLVFPENNLARSQPATPEEF